MRLWTRLISPPLTYLLSNWFKNLEYTFQLEGNFLSDNIGPDDSELTHSSLNHINEQCSPIQVASGKEVDIIASTEFLGYL